MKDPITGITYRRYVQTIGVDISISDGSIYKNPTNVKPRSFSIGKFPDCYYANDPTVFGRPYNIQSMVTGDVTVRYGNNNKHLLENYL